MHTQISAVIKKLVQNDAFFDIKRHGLIICTRCGTTLQPAKKRGAYCHRCRTHDSFQEHICNEGTRTARYVFFLHSVGLWPTLDSFDAPSAGEIDSLVQRGMTHHCEAGTDCPLMRELSKLQVELSLTFITIAVPSGLTKSLLEGHKDD